MDRRGRARSRLPGEFELIHRYFAPLAEGSALAFGLQDDAAVLRPPRDADIVVTKDAIVEGVHFRKQDPPDRIAQKLLRVNLSDLAAKGAKPLAYLLATAFPKSTSSAWLAGFSRGLSTDQREFGVTLIGGDTVATPGALTLSLTMLGMVPRGSMRRRGGARPGDRIYVTGTLGDAYFGLRLLEGKFSWLGPSRRRFLIDRYQVPQPRVAFGVALGFANAGIDISDGLIADLGHVAKASGLGAVIEQDRIPLSPAARAIVRRHEKETLHLVTHGDDYELLFTVPPSRATDVEAIAARMRTKITPIGEMVWGKDVCLKTPDARLLRTREGQGGFTHF